MFEKISGWFRDSLTILWARILVLVGVVSQALLSIGLLPEVQTVFQILFTPQTAALSIATIGIVTELARRRTLPRG